MPETFWPTVGRHFMEVLAGVGLVVLGVALTVTASTEAGQTWQLFVGSFGTVFGGAALSWTVGKAVSKEEALQEVRSRLHLVSRTLGQAAGQINRIVDQCSDQSLPAETGFAMVGQSSMLVGAQVSEIQGILGGPIEYGELLSTISEMENLAENLDRKGRRGDVGQVKSRLKEMRAEIESSALGTGRRTESIPCPSCSNEQSVSLGMYPGDTAQTRCSKCRKAFNSHRRSDGTAFSRPLGNSAMLPQDTHENSRDEYLTQECPDCGDSLRFRSGLPKDRKIVCLKCGAACIRDAQSGQLIQTAKYVKRSGIVTGRYGSGGTGARPIVTCSECGQEIRCIIRKPDADYGLDYECNRIHEVTSAQLRVWREANEPQTLLSSVAGDSSEPCSDAVGSRIGHTGEALAGRTPEQSDSTIAS